MVGNKLAESPASINTKAPPAVDLLGAPGAAGSMNSLQQFMHDKRLPIAIRLDRNPPSLQEINVATTQSQSVQYQLLNLPHYLCVFAREISRDFS